MLVDFRIMVVLLSQLALTIKIASRQLVESVPVHLRHVPALTLP
jgi:hypothetical protein